MKSYILSFLLLFSSFAWGYEVDTLKLWPGDPTRAKSELYVFHPAKQEKPVPALVYYPGGGYGGHSFTGSCNIAKWFASNGFVAAVLVYRLPERGHHERPLEDAEQAMRIMRDHAKEWNIDLERLGAAGASSGGHLCATVSTLASPENRPKFALIYYPDISMTDAEILGGWGKNMLGDQLDNPELLARYSLEKHVDEFTPPSFIVMGDDDDCSPPEGAILYYKALHEKGISAALHMFVHVGHGFGIDQRFNYYHETKDLIWKWLKVIHIID